MTINPALSRGIQIFLLISLCVVLSPHPKQQAQTNTSPPAGLNILSIPYYSIKGDWESTLTLTCAWPQPLTASLKVFSLDGSALSFSDFHLDPYQSMPLRLSDLTRREGERGQFQEGSIELRYNGPALAIGAQLTVQDFQHSLSFDMEPPTAPFKSSTLEGLWWSLDEKTDGQIMISNRTIESVTVLPTVQWQGTPRPAPAVALSPHQTAVIEVSKLLKDLNIDSRGIGLGGLTLSHNGPPGAVIAHGVIVNKDTGFSSNLNFIDPAAQKASVIEGTGLMLGHPADAALRPADFFTPVLLLKNITQTPQTVGVTLQYSVSGSLQLKMLPAIDLAPHEVRMADFSSLLPELQGVAVDDAGIKIESSGSPGSVLAQLTSINERGEMSVDVPLKAPPPRSVGNGAHPFSFDGDTQAVLHLKNMGSQPTQARVKIFFTGGEYDPELVLLQPAQSLAIDLRQIRDSQKKDIHGHQLPQDLSRGQVHWFQSGGQSVVGHLVSLSPSQGVSATFSCANGCCGDSFVSLNVDPADGSILQMTVDESITVLVTEQKLTCTGGSSFRDVSTDSMTTISSSDTSVAAINPGVKNQIDLKGSGSATITVSRPETTFDSVPGDCLPPFPTFDEGGGGTCPPVCIESAPFVVTSTFTVVVQPSVTISQAQSIVDGTMANFNVTVKGANPTGYLWSFTAPAGSGNSPSVIFTPNGGATTQTDGHWFAFPDLECGASLASTYTIACKVTLPGGVSKSVQTTLTVSLPPQAGETLTATIQGRGPEIGFDTVQNKWVVVGPGELKRILPVPSIFIPATSQFYGKTVAHENVHVRQWESGLFSNLWTVQGYMNFISVLQDDTIEGLTLKIAIATKDFNTLQFLFNLQGITLAESEAHGVSDPITPQYLYQRCGRF